MADKKRVVIIGGGMAGLAAAYELSSTAPLRATYEVTVYQAGWRLGGKCASTRGVHPADPSSSRIEEHGLHVWFGFYYNAFRMLRACYAQLGEPQLTIAEMFGRRSSTPMVEAAGTAHAPLWPLDFPEDADGVEPGVTPGLPTITQTVRRILKFFTDHAHRIADDFPKEAQDPSGIAWLKQTLGQKFGALLPQGLLAALAEALAPIVIFSEDEIEFVGRFIDDAGAGQWEQVRLDILALPPSLVSDELRRSWILSDLALAVLRGLRDEATRVALGGFGVLDDRDFREWLTAKGAHAESVDSAPVRALYDLCFAYVDGDSSSFASANFAAGTALRCIVRITMGYHGAVCYTMNAGMGEAVIAPMYRVLSLNGVRFEFFHRADRIELDAGHRPLRIHFTRQARVDGGGPYQPLEYDGNGLGFWPRAPFFGQLVDGTALEASGQFDMDDIDAAWYGEVPATLELTAPGGDRAVLIVAISAGGLPKVADDINQAFASWGPMIDSTLTVATQSAQLWMNVDLAGLGYERPDQPPAMIAAPEPMDVWADMQQVIASEDWDPNVKPLSVQYLCGPLKGDFASQDDAIDQVAATTRAWLDAMSQVAWPGSKAGGGFDPQRLVGTVLKFDDRLRQQHLRANYQSSERYVLSVKGSIAKRLAPDALAGFGLYLAGDWTLNGLNAGCVEAAMMSGMQAAHALWGESPATVPGATDIP